MLCSGCQIKVWLEQVLENERGGLRRYELVVGIDCSPRLVGYPKVDLKKVLRSSRNSIAWYGFVSQCLSILMQCK